MGGVIVSASARNFEIQRLSGGRWLLDSVSDDKQVAIAMANALMKSGRAPFGVQVMAVQKRPDGQFGEVRIYRLTPEEQKGAEATLAKSNVGSKPKLRVERQRDDANEAGRVRLRAAPRRRALSLNDRTAWVAIGFVLVLCAVSYFWRQPQAPWAFDRPEAQTKVKERIPLP